MATMTGWWGCHGMRYYTRNACLLYMAADCRVVVDHSVCRMFDSRKLVSYWVCTDNFKELYIQISIKFKSTSVFFGISDILPGNKYISRRSWD